MNFNESRKERTDYLGFRAKQRSLNNLTRTKITNKMVHLKILDNLKSPNLKTPGIGEKNLVQKA